MAKKSARKELQKALDEESSETSEEESSFRSIETDPNQTDYNIELERSHNNRNNQPSTSSQAAAMVRRSPKKKPRLQQQPQNRAGTSKQAQSSFLGEESSSSSSEEEEVQSPPNNRSQTRSQQQKQPKAAAVQRNPVGAAKRKQKAPSKRVEPKLTKEYVGSQIPKAAFGRIVRFFVEKHSSTPGFRMTKPAFEALQTASEVYLTGMLGDAYQITLSRRQVTLMPRDINVLMYLRGPASKMGTC